MELWCWKYSDHSDLFSGDFGLNKVKEPILSKQDLEEIDSHKKYSVKNKVKITINKEEFLIEIDKEGVFVVKEHLLSEQGSYSLLTVWYKL
jgi:hypothetical protein